MNMRNQKVRSEFFGEITIHDRPLQQRMREPIKCSPYIPTTLEPVRSHELAAWWPRVVDQVREAIHRGGRLETAEDVLERLKAADAQLWLICAPHAVGVIITEIFVSSRGRTCAVPIAAGENLETHIVPVLEKLEQWAAAEGCTRLEGFGRAGWVRALRPFGWHPLATIIEKDLRHGV